MRTVLRYNISHTSTTDVLPPLAPAACFYHPIATRQSALIHTCPGVPDDTNKSGGSNAGKRKLIPLNTTETLRSFNTLPLGLPRQTRNGPAAPAICILHNRYNWRCHVPHCQCLSSTLVA